VIEQLQVVRVHIDAINSDRDFYQLTVVAQVRLASDSNEIIT
jgi:hypothetical protein